MHKEKISGQEVSREEREAFLGRAKQQAIEALQSSSEFILFAVHTDASNEECLADIKACGAQLLAHAAKDLLLTMKQIAGDLKPPGEKDCVH